MPRDAFEAPIARWLGGRLVWRAGFAGWAGRAAAFGNALGQGLVDASVDTSQPQREADAEYLRELNRAKSTQIQNMQPAYTGGTEWAADVRAARAAQSDQVGYLPANGEVAPGQYSAIGGASPAAAAQGVGGLSGLATSPEILFGTGQQSILPTSYGGDYTTWANGVSEQGIPQVEVTLHRGGLTRADELLQATQDAIDQVVQRTQDDGASAYASGDKASAAMAALSYLPDRLVGDAIKGIVGLPRLYTSNHMLPGLVGAAANPLATARAGFSAFEGLSTQDKVVSAVELLGPAALKLGPSMFSRLSGSSAQGIELGNVANVEAAAGAGTGRVTVTTYRVEGSPNQRIMIDEVGNVSLVPDNDSRIWLNFGQQNRATSYLQTKIDKGLPDAQMKSFDVDSSFLDQVRSDAVPERVARQYPDKPIISADPWLDQFGIPKSYFDQLMGSIIQGTGKVGP